MRLRHTWMGDVLIDRGAISITLIVQRGMPNVTHHEAHGSRSPGQASSITKIV